MQFNKPFEPHKWQIPEFFNIAEACLERQVKNGLGDKEAMILEDETTGIHSLTYAQLNQRAAQFAALLRSLNLQAQDRVLIRLPNSLEYPVCFLGAIRFGGIAVPTSSLLTGEEVRYLAADSGARVLCTHKKMWEQLAANLTDLPHLTKIILCGEGPLPENTGTFTFLDFEQELSRQRELPEIAITRSDDPAYLVYTSGTTGYPKGVLHAQRALLGRLPAAWYWFPFGEGRDERILHSGKFNWTYVLGTGLMDPLFHGKTVVVYEGQNNAQNWIELIARHRCTIFIGVPTIYRQILQKTSATASDVPTLRHCMCAGEHLSDDVFLEWKKRFKQDIYEAIGMSECSYYISHSIYRPTRPGSAGMAQPGHDIRLIDADFNEVPNGEEGMIAIPLSDPGLFIRYWNLPEEDARLRRNGFFLTGDYARRDSEGYLWFMGRKDDIIKTFGYRVSPHEIERVYKNHPEVADCVALGEEIAQDKILPVIVITPVAGAQLNAEELLEYGRVHLADYKRPKKVYLSQTFPRTKNGKVLRSDLKKMLEKGALSHA